MKTLDCGGCGATLDVSALAPGTTFSCGGCAASLTVPARAAAQAPASAPAARPAKRPPAPAAKASAPAPTRASRAGASTPRASRRGGGAGGDAPKAKSKGPLIGGIVAGVLLLGGGFAVFSGKKGGEPPPEPPRPAMGPATAGTGPVAAPAKAPENLSTEEIAWRAATTSAAKETFVEERLAGAAISEDGSKALHAFLEGKHRTDLGKKVALARLGTDPKSAWANGVLGRIDMTEALTAVASTKETADIGSEGAKRILDRVAAGRTWVDIEDLSQVQADLAAVKEVLVKLTDPWWKEATGVLKEIEASPAYARFLPVEIRAIPPYLVIAQVNTTNQGMATVNVLDNHVKFFHCLTGEFLKIMGEAGLPTTTLGEMGNPVLKAFVFRNRSTFDIWHWDQGWPKDGLKGVRAYYAWGGTQFMMMYDTGASSETQNEDTCVAFHEATHQLVHYYRRHYLTLEDRKKDPAAPEVDLLDGRLNGNTHWFQEGFAEFFGAADRISVQTGEWKLFRPYRSRMYEWGDPLLRKDPQWTLEEVIRMPNSMVLGAMSEKKWPEHKETMNSLFYAQAWSLNYLLYFGKDGKYRDRFLKYVNEEMRCNGGFKMFLQCMGVDEAGKDAFLEELQDDWISNQKYLIRKDKEGR